MERNTNNALIGGVAAGLSETLQMPVFYIRGFFILTFLFWGLGFFLYFLAWALWPENHGQTNLRFN